ncbi:MAG: DUF1566 domain-containing protein [Sulfurimonas sp.]|nr:DUF1566 domain-containing protein [Sulfurimonas sp.]MCK4973989.1 DUF1566 domain-containing protein [Sulfurimonas sp.]
MKKVITLVLLLVLGTTLYALPPKEKAKQYTRGLEKAMNAKDYKKAEANKPKLIAGLMWQDEEYTEEERRACKADTLHGKTQNWQGAKNYCRDLNLAGYSDWYLPSKSQLESLYNNRSQLKNNMPDFFWSSTGHESNSSLAWDVSFRAGATLYYYKSYVDYVRCVRAGQ